MVVGVIDPGRMADGPLFLGPLAGVGALGLACRLGKGVFGGFCALRFSWGVGVGALDEAEQIPGGVRRWWGGGQPLSSERLHKDQQCGPWLSAHVRLGPWRF